MELMPTEHDDVVEAEETEHTYCRDCKTVDGCSCDEQFEAWRDSQRD